MEKVSYIALAIPVFFILIGVELLIGVLQKRTYYRLNDSITNITLGIGQQLVGIFMKGVFSVGYIWLYKNWRLVDDIGHSAWIWLALFLGVDFFYYWFHRMSHEINALWAAHIVHHQSEDYNLSVALRQSWFQGWFSWAWYLPLAIIGFEPVMFATLASFNTLYQFWIHTRAIGKLGPFEWIFNTPSHHRVHHGSNPKYIDKNHAGTFIIWDRMFGTFQEEEEEPVYGITKPLASWNPLWANFHYWFELAGVAAKTKKWSDKVKVFLKPPGWHPEELGGFQAPPEIDVKNYKKYDAGATTNAGAYTFFQFVFVLLLSTVFISFQKDMDVTQKIALGLFVLLSIVNLGAIFEQKNWVYLAEFFRFILAVGFTFLFRDFEVFNIILAVAVVYAAVSFIWFYSLNRRPQVTTAA